MIEATLRHMTGGCIHVVSAGVHHDRRVHPMSETVLAEAGIPFNLSTASSKSTSAVFGDAQYNGITTFDISIAVADDPSGIVEGETDGNVVKVHEDGDLSFDPSSFPTHWSMRSSNASVKRDWRLWSLVRSENASEVSPNTFTDHYQGEPLWLQMVADNSLSKVPVKKTTWYIPPLADEKPMEREWQRLERFREARDLIIKKCHVLLEELKARYQEPELIQVKVALPGAESANGDRIEVAQDLPSAHGICGRE